MSTPTNTTRVGDEFEKQIFDYFRDEIDAGRMPFKKDCCKLFAKKGYYSRDRCSEIIFDISLEIYLPGQQQHLVLLLIECKRYSHPVPVDDVEEFFAKVEQVGAANTKAIVVSTAPYQKGAREFANAKKMGLARYFGPENFKWELQRSLAVTASASGAGYEDLERGLSDDVFPDASFDFYFQGPQALTNSLWDFIEDTCAEVPAAPHALLKARNKRRAAREVAFLAGAAIEDLGASVLSRIGYSGGEVALQEICKRELVTSGLQVQLDVPHNDAEVGARLLGRITFDPLVIQVFAQSEPNQGRERFTLAHEMAHHFLDHGRYLVHESCDSNDFVLHRTGMTNAAIARLEFQANYMASSMLLPRARVIHDFHKLMRTLGIADKGFGALYVDDQPCNLHNYEFVTGQLMKKYAVSRSAVRIRLETLQLLRDKRTVLSVGQMVRWNKTFL
ncbi:restriction endonuclease [Paraburkholderia sp. GV068]|uniref:ImmA/IrrE family metallo-endopeptidase n=1 Tax=unclassified Paraburkholderia TaxID=2615204 RepID=UPI000D2FD2F3|nr:MULTISPECIES: restriction endonuclease [unclassified Paraburkholderia]PTR00264.1 restriction endonuclease [Paraburkholderia sp. GV072]PUB05112.1 restriction endonuclease [Paraburkholderia sp. GV068]